MPLSKKTFGSALLLIIYFTAVLGKILLPLKEEQAYRKPIIRSNTKQEAFNHEANLRAEVFLAERFCPTIRKELSQELGQEANIFIDPNDRQTIIFAYPNLFINQATLQIIRLEIGALAAWTPVRSASITSYAANYYPKLFSQTSTAILTVLPERTFWEKATILHHEANRPEHLSMPPRYSRHYYDIYRMSQSPIKDYSLLSLNLLSKVVAFKMKFYPRAWAKYSEAKPGSLKLLPPNYRFSSLEKDYSAMKDMLFGNIPSFNDIIDTLTQLEIEINSLS